LSDLVETYSGHRLHDRPLRFQLNGSWKTVDKVLSSWQEPESLGFTVLAEDGQRYALKYNRESDFWEVVIISRPAAQSPA